MATTVAWLLWEQPIVLLLDLRPVTEEEMHARYYKPGPEPMAKKNTGPKYESATTILLIYM